MTRVARRPDYWPEFFAKSLQNSNMDFSPDLPFFEGREPGLASPKNSAGTDAMGRWGGGAMGPARWCHVAQSLYQVVGEHFPALPVPPATHQTLFRDPPDMTLSATLFLSGLLFFNYFIFVKTTQRPLVPPASSASRILNRRWFFCRAYNYLILSALDSNDGDVRTRLPDLPADHTNKKCEKCEKCEKQNKNCMRTRSKRTQIRTSARTSIEV